MIEKKKKKKTIVSTLRDAPDCSTQQRLFCSLARLPLNRHQVGGRIGVVIYWARAFFFYPFRFLRFHCCCYRCHCSCRIWCRGRVIPSAHRVSGESVTHVKVEPIWLRAIELERPKQHRQDFRLHWPRKTDNREPVTTVGPRPRIPRWNKNKTKNKTNKKLNIDIENNKIK